MPRRHPIPTIWLMTDERMGVALWDVLERLPRGAGYRVHIESMSEPFSTDRKIAALQTNCMIEKLIAMAPAQYLWGYNRYKRPAGAPLPETR